MRSSRMVLCGVSVGCSILVHLREILHRNSWKFCICKTVFSKMLQRTSRKFFLKSKLKILRFNVSFSFNTLKRICNWNDIMVSLYVTFSKENIFFKVIHFKHRRQGLLEKNLNVQQNVSWLHHKYKKCV